MDRFRVVGGARLAGAVRVSGAKNSALKLMSASLLAVGKSKITNLPAIADGMRCDGGWAAGKDGRTCTGQEEGS